MLFGFGSDEEISWMGLGVTKKLVGWDMYKDQVGIAMNITLPCL